MRQQVERPGTHCDALYLYCNSACASRVKTYTAKQGEMGIPTVQAAQEAVAGGLPRGALEPMETSSEGKKEGEREGKKGEKCELGEAQAAASARSLSRAVHTKKVQSTSHALLCRVCPPAKLQLLIVSSGAAWP